MKKFLFFAPLVTAALLFSTCKKESTAPVAPAATVTIHDTIYIQPPTRLQTLTEKVWEIDEVNRNNAGSNTRYIKGGFNNTGTSYNLFKLKFNVDGTGTYTDETGISHSLNWSFTGANQRSITLNVGPPFATSFVWYTVEIAGNYMHQTSVSGNSSLLSARFVQIP